MSAQPCLKKQLVCVTPILRQHAHGLFCLIDANRAYLSQFGENTAKNYPTLLSILQSIISPENPRRSRFVILVPKMEKKLCTQIVGGISLTRSENDSREGTVGYWIAEEFSNQGFMTEALSQLVKFASENGYGILKAKTHKDNIGGIRVLEKNGFIGSSSTQPDTLCWFRTIKRYARK